MFCPARLSQCVRMRATPTPRPDLCAEAFLVNSSASSRLSSSPLHCNRWFHKSTLLIASTVPRWSIALMRPRCGRPCAMPLSCSVKEAADWRRHDVSLSKRTREHGLASSLTSTVARTSSLPATMSASSSMGKKYWPPPRFRLLFAATGRWHVRGWSDRRSAGRRPVRRNLLPSAEICVVYALCCLRYFAKCCSPMWRDRNRIGFLHPSARLRRDQRTAALWPCLSSFLSW